MGVFSYVYINCCLSLTPIVVYRSIDLPLCRTTIQSSLVVPPPARVEVIAPKDPVRGEWCPSPAQMPVSGVTPCQELRRCAYLNSYDPQVRATQIIDCKCDTNTGPENTPSLTAQDHVFVCQAGDGGLYDKYG